MPRAKPSELPAHMAVLGLVIERPNQTVSYYAQALARRFPRARFAAPTAYNALKQMGEGRSVRVERTHTAPGEDRSDDRHAPTQRGHEVYRAWMYASPASSPPIREAIYGRIKLAGIEHLPRLIYFAREEERIAIDLWADAKDELRKHKDKRDHRARRAGRVDYVRRIRDTWLYVDPLHWSSRAVLFDAIAEHLEEIADEAGIEFEVPDEAGLDLSEMNDVGLGAARRLG
jgi:hypothetical protein